jgi:hypothetical protein
MAKRVSCTPLLPLLFFSFACCLNPFLLKTDVLLAHVLLPHLRRATNSGARKHLEAKPKEQHNRAESKNPPHLFACRRQGAAGAHT